jgi:hypothetical protein
MLTHRRSAASTERTRSDLNLATHKFSVLFRSGHVLPFERKAGASKFGKIKSKALCIKDASTSSVVKGLLHPRRALFVVVSSSYALFLAANSSFKTQAEFKQNLGK